MGAWGRGGVGTVERGGWGAWGREPIAFLTGVVICLRRIKQRRRGRHQRAGSGVSRTLGPRSGGVDFVPPIERSNTPSIAGCPDRGAGMRNRTASNKEMPPVRTHRCETPTQLSWQTRQSPRSRRFCVRCPVVQRSTLEGPSNDFHDRLKSNLTQEDLADEGGSVVPQRDCRAPR